MHEKADAQTSAVGDEAEQRNAPPAAEETLLEIGAEGGSISLIRVSRGGFTEWIMETNEWMLVELLDDEDPSAAGLHRRELGPTFADALAGLDRYQWFRLVPLFVHAEIRDAVQEAVRERGGEASLIRWKSLLGQDRERRIVFPEALRRFVDEERWTFAKSMPDWPHEYLVRERVDGALFELLVRHIRAHGTEGRFYRKPITYYEEAGLVYWTMGAPLAETIIINRCRKEQTFEYREAHGLLPE